MQSAHGGVQLWQMKFYSGLKQRLDRQADICQCVDRLADIHIAYLAQFIVFNVGVSMTKLVLHNKAEVHCKAIVWNPVFKHSGQCC